MKTSTAVLSMLAVAFGAALFMAGRHSGTVALPGGQQAEALPSPPAAGDKAIPAPWQIEALPDGGLRALGLVVGHSTLGDAVQRYGMDTQVAVVAAPGEDGHLEAYVDPAQADFVSGKLVVSAQATSAQLQGWKSRAVKAEFMESTTRRYILATNDLVEATKATVVGLSFIPQAQLDAPTVIARFGEPTERLHSAPHAEHLLYPAKGLDVMVDADGKELLQYVSPKDFEARLRRPLMQAQDAHDAQAGAASR
jgi:hypothetical protein